MQRSLLLFEESIKSENTRKNYKYQLSKFLKYFKIKDYDSLLTISKEKLQEMLEDYIFHLKKALNPNTVPVAFAPIELFFTIQDVQINFKRLHKMFPEKIKKAGYNSWSTKEIQAMLRTAIKKRTRALILFLASSGCRIGVIEELRIKHLKEMSKNCKRVLCYEGSKEEYKTFLTPEASKALDEYLAERTSDRENLTLESPVFREGYQLGMKKAKPISKQMAQTLIGRCIKRAKLSRKKLGNRYDKQISHGFRKHFNTILKLNNEVNSNIAEKLMGHKKGLDGVYLTPTEEECFNEFLKAVPDLTIDDTERLAARNKELENEKTELEKKIPQLVNEAVDRIKEQLRKEGSIVN